MNDEKYCDNSQFLIEVIERTGRRQGTSILNILYISRGNEILSNFQLKHNLRLFSETSPKTRNTCFIFIKCSPLFSQQVIFQTALTFNLSIGSSNTVDHWVFPGAPDFILPSWNSVFSSLNLRVNLLYVAALYRENSQSGGEEGRGNYTCIISRWPKRGVDHLCISKRDTRALQRTFISFQKVLRPI